ncbi:hypothetical protein L917_12077 [Phytophthora nicotianae]|uniref:Uncharacterized protein n=1 Tax=Phytophthora nicotianae TaxID=4792 RepID=W2KUR3_PHYNI|nr:hypothetical protein L917_12077 [Phytophthora nicotianae]
MVHKNATSLGRLWCSSVQVTVQANSQLHEVVLTSWIYTRSILIWV